MTNEELALRIQAGQNEYMADLWIQNQGILYKLSARYLWRAEKMRYDLEDLVQECYFALVAAVKAYKPDGEYQFLAYLRYHVMNVLADMLMFRNNRDRYIVPVSLDQPVSGDGADEAGEETTLKSFLPAPMDTEEEAIRAVESQQLRELLRATLSAEDMAILLERFRDPPATLSQLAQKYGGTASWMQERLRRLIRTVQRQASLKGFVPERRAHRYKGGFGSFKTSWTSSTEAAALDNIDLEQRYLQTLLDLLGNATGEEHKALRREIEQRVNSEK